VRAIRLHIFVTLTEHIVERLNFFLAAAFFARFFKIAFRTNVADNVFAIELFLHAANRLVHAFTFTDFDFYGHWNTVCLKID